MKRLLEARVERILADGVRVRLGQAERDALVEIAFLAMAADGLLRDEEIEAFTEAMRALVRPDAESDTVRRTVEHLVEQEEWLDADTRLRQVALRLAPGFAREQAYKLGVLMILSDFDTNMAETAFEHSLRRALDLGTEQAERLCDEVCCAVSCNAGA